MAEGFQPSTISGERGIIGVATRDAETNRFNDDVYEVSIAVDHGYTKDGVWTKTGTTFVTYSAVGSYADVVKTVAKGDRVKVSGNWSLETRGYEKNDGTPGFAVSARYGELEILEAAADRPPREASGSFVPETAGAGLGGFN